MFGLDWSSDGTRIAFSMSIIEQAFPEIYTSLPDGTDRQNVTTTANNG
jgi:hypothetical protein